MYKKVRAKIILVLIFAVITSSIFFVLHYKLDYKADQTTEVPSKPTQISSSIMSATDIKINWENESNNELGFKIERSTNYEDGFTEIASTGPNINSYTDSSLDTSKFYYYRVKAYNTIGDSAYSELTLPPREVNYDLLTGIGDMNKSTHTTYRENYVNYDIESTENDQVANGWYRMNDPSVIPKTNSIYRINQENGIKSQYMAVKGTNSNTANISVNNELDVPTLDLQQGDTLRLEFDNVKFSGYENLPNGSTVQFGIGLYGQAGNTDPNVNYANMFFINKDNIDPTSSGQIYKEGLVIRDLNIGGVDYPNHPIGHLYTSLGMSVKGDIGDAQPGVSFSGVHIYVKKVGQSDFEKETVPVPRNRNIETGLVFYNPNVYDPYETASNFDWVSTDYNLDKEVSKLKYYNPNIKVYFYMAAAVMSDYRDENFNDWKNPDVQFNWAINNHPEWFYSRYRDPINKTGDMIPPAADGDPRPGYKRYANAADYAEYYPKFLATGDTTKQIPYYFDMQYPQSYLINPSIPSYQDYYYNSVVKAHNYYGFDGVFVDTLAAPGPWSVIDPSQDLQKLVKPDQIQKFQESVFPRLREAGITTIHNNCSAHYSTYGGLVALNPYWEKSSFDDPNKPTALTDIINNYYGGSNPIALFNNNSPDMTADFFFQEWAFFGNSESKYNVYSLSEWLSAITDMDYVTEWNANLPDDKKKKIFQLVHGVDRPEDPALGTNGWAQFGLTSYLLGSSDYSWLGEDYAKLYENREQIVSTYPLSTNLGDSLEQRVDLTNPTNYNSDHSLQSRQFDNGLVIVNGNSTDDRSFQLSEDMYAEDGILVPAGTVILPKHSGRILMRIPNIPTLLIGNLPTYKTSIDLKFKTAGEMEKLYVSENEAEKTSLDTWKKTVALNIGKNSYQVKAQDKYGKFSKELSIDFTRLKMADPNNDGKIDIKDFSIILSSWGSPKNYLADFNEDGRVDIKDFSILLANWGK